LKKVSDKTAILSNSGEGVMEKTAFEFVIYGLMGIGLSASCGLRVFVPMLVMSIAVKAGKLELATGWSWLGEWPALITFSVATAIEVIGYLIPWVDHVLDVIATPAAVVAGTIATAACISGIDPLLQWSAAIIAGGGIAAVVQGTTVVTRGTSTATTGSTALETRSTLRRKGIIARHPRWFLRVITCGAVRP